MARILKVVSGHSYTHTHTQRMLLEDKDWMVLCTQRCDLPRARKVQIDPL